jgi:hypothetical protein
MPRKAESFEDKYRRLAVAGENGCLEWTGPLSQFGYALFRTKRKNFRVHRWAYERFIGPIPEGKVLDHICRNRKCVNPHHLEPVTLVENLDRGIRTNQNRDRTYCQHGHEFTPENTYYSGGKRACKTCHYWRQRRKAKSYDPAEELVADD